MIYLPKSVNAAQIVFHRTAITISITKEKYNKYKVIKDGAY